MIVAVEDAEIAREADLILALNNAAIPAVNLLDRPALDVLLRMAHARVARLPDLQVAGVVLTMTAHEPYDSLNYRWFVDRFDDFLYVDRVIVDTAARGAGVGRALYEDAIRRAREAGQPRVCSEVNVAPPNPQSMAFHERLGFVPIAERLNEREGKVVAMMVREFAAPATGGGAADALR